MNAQIVELGFKARAWQWKALSLLKRFSVLIVHRRGGKTLAAVMKAIDAALRNSREKPRYAYIAPELKQAKAVAWDYLKHYVLRIPGSKVNEQETWVETPNGARIRIYGADDPDSLRGLYFDGIILDEVAQMKPNVWGEVLVPALADRQGWALFIGTPKGINLLSKLYFDALSNPDWYAETFTFEDTGALEQSELDEMRKNMTEQQWRQEMLCDFSASSDDTLISIELVRRSMGKHLTPDQYTFAPVIFGLDVAAMGGDKTVLQRRQGLASFKPDVWDLKDPNQIAELVAVSANVHKPQAIMIDNGGGYGNAVIFRLRELNYTVFDCNFGGKPRNERFENKAAEMWWDMKSWIEQGGSLPIDNQYLVDLTSRRYDTDRPSGKLRLESKDRMKARGMKSPDYGDALALTFAFPVHQPMGLIAGVPASSFLSGQSHQTEYNPFERYRKETEREYG